jgi:penicillin-binding protein 1C
VGAWVGRADGTAVADLTGRKSAAPLLFNAFATLKSVPAKTLPPKNIIANAAGMPATLKHFGQMISQPSAAARPLQIMFPPEGAKLSRVVDSAGTTRPMVMKLEGGAAPFRVLINGAATDDQFRNRLLDIDMTARGFSNVTVIDANGLVATVDLYLQ